MTRRVMSDDRRGKAQGIYPLTGQDASRVPENLPRRWRVLRRRSGPDHMTGNVLGKVMFGTPAHSEQLYGPGRLPINGEADSGARGLLVAIAVRRLVVT